MAKETAYSNGSSQHTVISYGTAINGDASTESDIRIDGSITGNVDCKGRIVIGSLGLVTGNITCANAEISGSVTGNIKTAETLSFKATSVVKGDIQTFSLSIEPGAQFVGSCEMLSNKVKTV